MNVFYALLPVPRGIARNVRGQKHVYAFRDVRARDSVRENENNETLTRFKTPTMRADMDFHIRGLMPSTRCRAFTVAFLCAWLGYVPNSCEESRGVFGIIVRGGGPCEICTFDFDALTLKRSLF